MYSDQGWKVYEGDFKNNTFSGKGTKHDSMGNVIYIGDFLDGKYHGIGTRYDSKLGEDYRGFFKEGEPFYQEFLGLLESKLKEVSSDPDENDSEEKASADFTTISYSKYSMEFLLNPVSKTRKMSLVQELNLSQIPLVCGLFALVIVCSMSFICKYNSYKC